MIEEFPYCWTQGDQRPDMSCTLQDQDLTGYGITLHLRRADGTVIVKSAVPVDLTQGHFLFEWDPGDLIAGTNQEAEIQFVDLANKPLTSTKFLINVRAQIA